MAGLGLMLQNTCREPAPNPANTDKTLVSWVRIHDIKIDGGSILTIQAGEEFDGIVLGELERGKWIAGSNEWTRTNRNMENLTAEPTTPSNGLIQMAVVYQDNHIRIYRNGTLYSSYTAENIDLLSRDDNVVVFGWRHAGGGGYIAGDIEDARIYGQALTTGQLEALKPDTASQLQPYAWWDFEGDTLLDRMGRYENYNVPKNNISIQDGKLKLRQWGFVIAARKYEVEKPRWPENPPKDWLTFHLAHPGPGIAEPGDPNAAYYHAGRYHLHYIYNSIFGFSYAHVSSQDMVHWQWHPTILAPPFTGHGMFSGTGFFTRKNKPVMIYHGFATNRNWLIYALDDNMDRWSKPEKIEPRLLNGDMPDMNHWDPDCWWNGDAYYAVSGGKNPDLMKSFDLKNWQYLGKLFHKNFPENLGVSKNNDISCANMFKIGGRWMLLCISHDLGCRYFLGDFKDEKYLPDFHAKMNWVNTNWQGTPDGLVYFAPESILAADGRRVMWAWLITDIMPSGIQSIPRELELPDDGVLRIRPLRELEFLRYNEMVRQDITVRKGGEYKLSGITGDALELYVTFSTPLPGEFGIDLLSDANGANGLSITAGVKKNTLSIGSINPPFNPTRGKDLTLRIFIDKNLVEVFANDRQAAAVAHDHIRADPNIRLFTRDRECRVSTVKAWNMYSIYEN